MESTPNRNMKGKGKKGLITKTWERCKSFGRGRKSSSLPSPSSWSSKTVFGSPVITRSRSWPSRREFHDDYGQDREKKGKKGRVAPEGCFSVYVGPQMQRFVIKTEYANHPLFKMLLEEAESEYGYSSQGPLALPCHVDMFYKVLMEMDQDGNRCEDQQARQGCGFVKRTKSYQLLSPSRMAAINHF